MLVTLLLVGAGLIAVLALFFAMGNRPISPTDADEKIRKALGTNGKPIGMLLVDSRDLGVRVISAVGHSCPHGISMEPETPFHIASVGKLFTTAIIGMLLDERKLRLDDVLTEYLDRELLAGLYVLDGQDNAAGVSIRSLLEHTSGTADYYGDKGVNGRTGADLLVEEPEKLWSPQDIVDYARNNLEPVGKPGERFHYSDTGFVLLGLVAEAVTGCEFHSLLHKRIFQPLGMAHSYMPFRSEPELKSRPAPAIIGGTNVVEKRSITLDWAGGGIISTLDDLLAFGRAFLAGDLVSDSTRQQLFRFSHRFRRGMHYGAGVMEYHLEEFFFLLTGLPHFRGHLGILATHLVYDPDTDTIIVVNCGSDKSLQKSFQLMIQVASILRRVRSP